MFRSQDMNLCKLIVTKDKAYDIVEALGMLDEVFFVNLNLNEQPQKLPYCHEVSKTNEISTKLEYIFEECLKNRVKIQKCKDYQDFILKKYQLQVKMKMSKQTIIDSVSKTVGEKYSFLKEQNERIEGMYTDYNDLLEYRKVIEVSKEMLEGSEFQAIRERIDSMSVMSERDSYDIEEVKRLMNDSIMSEISNDQDKGAGVRVGKVVGTCMN